MPKKIVIKPAVVWPDFVATLILEEIFLLSNQGRRISVMLTGGRSVRAIYSAWLASPEFWSISNVDFFIGDERCVPVEHEESNSGMVRRALFGKGMPTGSQFFPMLADGDMECLARVYETILPEKVDVLLLSVGEDGHIASLFPGSSALAEDRRCVVPVSGPKAPHDRLTITPNVIRNAREVFLLAQGEQKARLLERVLAGGEARSLPVSLAMDATWLLDTPIGGRV